MEYLIRVYRTFCKSNHHPRLYEIADEVEQALADVQLFGTPAQVRLVQKFADDLSAQPEAEINKILIELRNSLRAELGAEAIEDRHVWLKIAPPTK